MELPDNIGHPYQIIKLLGQGQFGKVFKAVDTETGEFVALKEIEYQKLSTHKFLREVNFLVTLQHPNIVGCQGLKSTHFARYIVMDYCDGGTLRDKLEARQKLSLDEALQITIDVLNGLEYAHAKGIVHCDLKPENILMAPEKSKQIAKISDFGIARLTHNDKTESMGVTGSPAYMAPERFYGKYSTSSDLYAVGVILFEMISGDRPFSGLPGKLMVAHLNQRVEFPVNIPFLVKKVITKALQKLPQKRFQSATEMLADVVLAADVENPGRRNSSS